MITVKKRLDSPECIFITLIILFGLLSTFVAYPFSNGDEGYHLSRSYSIFSKNNPKSMDVDNLRQIESNNTSQENSIQKYGWRTLIEDKIPDVESDSITFNFLNDNNSTLKLDIAHIPSAIGTLLGRITYPSYGVILIFARLANLIFYSICMFFIIKSSQIGKWSLIMLFSIPFLQKIASPSYDVFSYVAIAAFTVNIFSLIKQERYLNITYKRIGYTILSILMILFSKNNYIFILLLLLALPPITDKFVNFYKKSNMLKKVLVYLILIIFTIGFVKITNDKFDLLNFGKQFFNSYINVETVGRRARTLFNIVPTILPDMFNLFWCLSLFFVMLTENGYKWRKLFIINSSVIFLVNWIGIYAGFYLILGNPSHQFDDLSGRYLHPFIICFLPLIQWISSIYGISVTQKSLKIVALGSTIIVMVAYLLVCYYRGFIIHITPTWNNR